MGDRMRLTDAVSGLFVDKQSIARRISSQEITIVSRHLILIPLIRHQLPKSRQQIIFHHAQLDNARRKIKRKHWKISQQNSHFANICLKKTNKDAENIAEENKNTHICDDYTENENVDLYLPKSIFNNEKKIIHLNDRSFGGLFGLLRTGASASWRKAGAHASAGRHQRTAGGGNRP